MSVEEKLDKLVEQAKNAYEQGQIGKEEYEAILQAYLSRFPVKGV